MPRSSRHKSSRHREVKEYSDSEKESGLKEKKGRDDVGNIGSSSNRHLKDSSSAEKRKNESKSADICKDLSGLGGTNADYVDVLGVSSSLSKKRKEKEDDDRWTGGDNEHDLSKSDSKRPSRREESFLVGFDGEEGKRSGSKVESKHHRSERKERSEKEGGSERDRKSSKSERLIDVVTGNDNASNEGSRKQGSGEERGAKHSAGNTDYNIQEDVRNTDAERESDRRVRRRKDCLGDGEKHQDGARELDDRKLSSRDDVIRSGKYKDESQKDERIRERYQEDVVKDNWHQDEKQRDSRATREYASGRSDDKHVRNEKKDLDASQKKSKPLGSEYDRQPDRERDRDRDYERDRGRDRDRDRVRHERDRDRERDRENDDREHDIDRDRDRERDRERDLDRGQERDFERDKERGRDRDRYHRDRERDRVRDRDYNHDRVRDRDYDHDHEYASHVDEKVSRYKDDRGRRRSPEGYDDYHGDKSRRMESEVDKERSLSRKTHVDSVISSSRRRASPSSRAYVSTDKYRDGIQEETKYGESLRDGLTSETLDKIPKYRSGEKRTKFDENHIGEYSERSPSAKASPGGLKERSPSTSVDRRFQNRTSRKRSLDVDEAERRSSGSNDMRDVSVNEDRQQGRDFSGKKPTGEEYPPPESPYHHKSSQGNISSHIPGPSSFRTGADSPSYMGPLVEETRGHSGSRYRRSVDPNVGRGPGNAWKGPNWPSPLPNGFMPFPPGPPGPHHGGFPPMLSQFPPLFGVRPSMEMNHPGMPYHMPDGDRFPGHVRPMGWQNMVEGSVPHFHGWDANNGVLRDESSMYGPGHMANAQRRDMNADIWKQNGDANMDVTSISQKDGHMVKASMDEASSAQGASRPHVESSCLDEGTSHKTNTSSGPSSTKEIPTTPAKVTIEKTPESSNLDETAHSVHAYLAKLDISIDMAAPELYNQFINLGVKGQSDSFDEVEPEYVQEKTVAKPEIANVTMGLTFFPAPKDSIFQKAMELYNTQSTKRRPFVISKGETNGSVPAAELVAEQVSVLKKEAESPLDYSPMKEELSIVVPDVVSAIAPEVEGKEAVILTSNEALKVEPLQSAELAPDLSDQGQAPALTVEKMDEDVKDDKMNIDDELSSAESTCSESDAIKSSTEVEVVNDDGKSGSAEFTTVDEQLDVAVSGPLVSSHDSVKVCESLISVSNESDSVILSRIHHAPESTH